MKIFLRYIKTTNANMLLFEISAFTIIYQAFTVLSSELLRRITAVVEQSQSSQLDSLVFIAIFVALGMICFDSAQNIVSTQLNNHLESRIQENILLKSYRLSKTYYDKYDSGTYLNLMISNTRDGVNHGTKMFCEYLSALCMIGFAAIYMLVLNLPIAVCIILFNILFRLCTRSFDKLIHKNIQKSIPYNERSNSLLLEILSNELVLRLWKKTQFFSERFCKIEKHIEKQSVKNFALRNSYDELMWFTKKIAEILIIYGFGGRMVSNGIVSISILLPFVYVGDVFAKGMNQWLYAKMDEQTANAHLVKVTDYLQQSKEEENKSSLFSQPQRGVDINFDHVSFDYGDMTVLSDVSFCIPAGSKVLIVGSNGSGKSTLLKLLMGLYQPSQGSITYGCKTIDELGFAGVAEQVCYIPQKPCLLEGTVAENILLNENINNSKLEQSLHAVSLQQLQNSPVHNLSAGEKQRVNIARA
ncbi:MAG: ABC transporter ATP-binding protein, partial [Parabacteroides sp.]|nr:ABC transporter ATP-binding protein [Parabacteroides sp.]